MSHDDDEKLTALLLATMKPLLDAAGYNPELAETFARNLISQITSMSSEELRAMKERVQQGTLAMPEFIKAMTGKAPKS